MRDAWPRGLVPEATWPVRRNNSDPAIKENLAAPVRPTSTRTETRFCGGFRWVSVDFSGFQWVSVGFSGEFQWVSVVVGFFSGFQRVSSWLRPGVGRISKNTNTTVSWVRAVCAPATLWVWGAPLGAGLLTAHCPPRAWLRVCAPSKKEKGEFTTQRVTGVWRRIKAALRQWRWR